MKELLIAIITGIISGYVANFFYEKHSFNKETIFAKLRKLLSNKNNWIGYYDQENKQTIWNCNKDNRFALRQKKIKDFNDKEFFEPYLKKEETDYGFSAFKISLLFNGIEYQLAGNDGLFFVSIYDGKLFYPVPEAHAPYKEAVYFWDQNALYYKIFELIGSLDIYSDVPSLINAKFPKLHLLKK